MTWASPVGDRPAPPKTAPVLPQPLPVIPQTICQSSFATLDSEERVRRGDAESNAFVRLQQAARQRGWPVYQ